MDSPTGRPAKNIADHRDRILAAIRAGATYKLAAQAGGISYDLLRQWLRRADAAGDGDEEYIAFAAALRQAEIEGLSSSLLIIRTSQDWRSHAWLLERRWPEDYGKRDHLELSGDEDKPITVNSITVIPVTRAHDNSHDQDSASVSASDEADQPLP